MADGYIKLYRKAIDNGWLKNQELWTFWCWCLLKASHKDCAVMVGYQRIELKTGQFVFGRKKASEELNLSERKIRTCLDSLRKRKNVTIKTTNKFSIISVINWDTYQIDNFQNDQQKANQRPANDQQTTTNNNGNNGKKIKKDMPKLEESFDNFYLAYPKHKGREDALKAWIKLEPSEELIKLIMEKVEIQKQNPEWKKEKGQYIPFPASWIRGKRWRDEGTNIADAKPIIRNAAGQPLEYIKWADAPAKDKKDAK